MAQPRKSWPTPRLMRIKLDGLPAHKKKGVKDYVA